MVSHKRDDAGPGPGNHTLPSLLIPPNLGRLSPRRQWGVRNRSCGLGKRAAWKQQQPHFVRKVKGLAKAFHDRPISHMSKGSFQLEATAHHCPDPSQISQPLDKHCVPK